MPQHRQATTGGLEHAAPLERDRGTVRNAEPALGAAIGRLSLGAAAAAQEQASGGLGWLGSADRDLRDGLSRRHSRPRDPPLGVRVRGAGAAKWWGACWEAERRAAGAADPRDRNGPRYHALQSTSAEPGRATPTRRAGCFWSALRSRRCASGWGADIKKGRSSGRSTDGIRGEEGAHTQSINLVVKRRCAMVGLELEAFFGARTSRRISDRGGAARDRATGGDAAVPAPAQFSRPRATTMTPSARRAGRQGWGSKEIVS